MIKDGGIMKGDFKAQEIIQNKFKVDKAFLTELLEYDRQNQLEKENLASTLYLVKNFKLQPLIDLNEEYQIKIEELENSGDFTAEKYKSVLSIKEKIVKNNALISQLNKQVKEPYFARMDLYDNFKEYMLLYIGKKGDRELKIVDWRAPIAKKYYQKSSLEFSFNKYLYKVILRRAFKIENYELVDWSNEYINLKDFLSKEEIAGRDESVVFDPFLKEILARRKDSENITDIIETIQEKQYEIITFDAAKNIIVQGCAGSGKTMILLHRLSYLMYNDEKILPEHILMLTPSDSFNDFIDELCNILEIEKVQTDTIDDYYRKLLEKRGIDLSGKIDFKAAENKSYLDYIHSPDFFEYIDAEINKIISSIKEFFSCEEFNDLKKTVLYSYGRQSQIYKRLKNSPPHIIKAVLGEIKINKEKNVYYTRQLRRLMSEMGVVSDFLSIDFNDVKFQSHYYFFNRYREFFESLKYLNKNISAVFSQTASDITAAITEINGQINHLKGFTKKAADGGSAPMFTDKILKAQKLLNDYQSAKELTERIHNEFDGIADLLTVIKSNQDFIHLGNAEGDMGLVRFLYASIIKKVKTKYKVPRANLIKSDLYVMVSLLLHFHLPLKLGQSYVFIDEGQDLSVNEYRLLTEINDTSKFNIFGDTEQNISGSRGVSDWQSIPLTAKNRQLLQNYRNTNQIVEYVKEHLGIEMQSIGFDGSKINLIATDEIKSRLSQKNGIKAVIAEENYLQALYKSDAHLYNFVGTSGKVMKNKINLLTVTESKGLEFSVVAVKDADFTKNERYIAYTRALKELYIIEN